MYLYAHLNIYYGLCQTLGTWVLKSYSSCYSRLWDQKPAPFFLSSGEFLSFLKYRVDFRPLFSFSQSWWRTDLLKLRYCFGDIPVGAPNLLQLRCFFGHVSVYAPNELSAPNGWPGLTQQLSLAKRRRPDFFYFSTFPCQLLATCSSCFLYAGSDICLSSWWVNSTH